jgi:hypothetical protein
MTTEPTSAELDLSAQELIYAGLEALEAAVALDLCAYLHVSGDFGPQLFLSSPALSSLDPAQAFDLFCALRDALDWAAMQADDASERVVELAGFSAVTVTTDGPHSRGLHAVGRSGRPLMDQERAVAGRLARALGTACHRLEAAGSARRDQDGRVESEGPGPRH